MLSPPLGGSTKVIIDPPEKVYDFPGSCIMLFIVINNIFSNDTVEDFDFTIDIGDPS